MKEQTGRVEGRSNKMTEFVKQVLFSQNSAGAELAEPLHASLHGAPPSVPQMARFEEKRCMNQTGG